MTALVSAVVAVGLWLMPACSLSSHGPGEASAPGPGLVYQPPALPPSPYVEASIAGFEDESHPFDAEEAWMPGATVAMSSIVTAMATGRVREIGGQLTESEMLAVLEEAGWPVEVRGQALRVAWCESKWSPYADGDSGRSKGLFQVNLETWFPYAGEDPTQWADPLTNARVALAVYRYDLARGQAAWTQWTCKPGTG